MLLEYVRQPAFRTVIMVILGIGLASMFRASCKGDRCVVIKAPDPSDVEKQVFKYGDGCYKFQAKMTSCE